MLRIVTRKTAKKEIGQIDHMANLLCMRSSSHSMDSYYPNRMRELVWESYELSHKYKKALKMGFQIIWK